MAEEQMKRYKNLSGESGVVAYEIDVGSITIKFSGGERYLYTDVSAGVANLAEMQRLARAGQGLCSFISRVIRNRYARKLG
jgi:hypothetical protein